MRSAAGFIAFDESDPFVVDDLIPKLIKYLSPLHRYRFSLINKKWVEELGDVEKETTYWRDICIKALCQKDAITGIFDTQPLIKIIGDHYFKRGYRKELMALIWVVHCGQESYFKSGKELIDSGSRPKYVVDRLYEVSTCTEYVRPLHIALYLIRR